MKMSMKNSYFELPSLVALLEKWLNPEVQRVNLTLRDRPLMVGWTRRAEKQMILLEQPLLAEMQLYFSCVVKKRVLFHQQEPSVTLEWITAGDHLKVAFRPVEASSCDPVEFAANYPVHNEFKSDAAVRMHPSRLQIDYRNGNWKGEFSV